MLFLIKNSKKKGKVAISTMIYIIKDGVSRVSETSSEKFSCFGLFVWRRPRKWILLVWMSITSWCAHELIGWLINSFWNLFRGSNSTFNIWFHARLVSPSKSRHLCFSRALGCCHRCADKSLITEQDEVRFVGDGTRTCRFLIYF